VFEPDRGPTDEGIGIGGSPEAVGLGGRGGGMDMGWRSDAAAWMAAGPSMEISCNRLGLTEGSVDGNIFASLTRKFLSVSGSYTVEVSRRRYKKKREIDETCKDSYDTSRNRAFSWMRSKL
jgi:hypothetical protein